jgi:hypothetical protein
VLLEFFLLVVGCGVTTKKLLLPQQRGGAENKEDQSSKIKN